MIYDRENAAAHYSHTEKSASIRCDGLCDQKVPPDADETRELVLITRVPFIRTRRSQPQHDLRPRTMAVIEERNKTETQAAAHD
jgi:hypothetical protein